MGSVPVFSSFFLLSVLKTGICTQSHLFKNIITYLYGCFTCMDICVLCLCLVPVEAREVIGSLEMELWMVVSWVCNQVSWKSSNQSLNH